MKTPAFHTLYLDTLLRWLVPGQEIWAREQALIASDDEFIPCSEFNERQCRAMAKHLALVRNEEFRPKRRRRA